MVLSPVNLTEFIPEKIDLILHFPPYENIRKGREGQGGRTKLTCCNYEIFIITKVQFRGDGLISNTKIEHIGE
jgi:hypothetical protein